MNEYNLRDVSKIEDTNNIKPNEAYSLYKSLHSGHSKRVEIYTAIEGLVAGNPPYPVKAMKDAGLESAANFMFFNKISLQKLSN